MSTCSPDDHEAAMPAPERRVVFVVGSGRSGTSTMSGTLQTLGMYVPQPEVVADDTNPKGFGEPQWAVDFHHRLLDRCNVQVSDARPQAWFEAGKLSTNEQFREKLGQWLEGQFKDGGPEIVVKDPRLAWFIGLWRSAAFRCGAVPSYVTMLRPVTEVVGSKQKYYDQRFGELNRIAAWVNMMLHTERATRGSDRAFIRYRDLLEDWTIPVFQLGEQMHLQSVKTATANNIRHVHNFIDPSLRRVQLTWDDVDCPKRLRDIAEESWQALNKLTDEGCDTTDVHKVLDELRSDYALYYQEGEAVTQSTAVAARREAQKSRSAPAAEPARPSTAEPARASTADRIAARVPYHVRAKIPAGARRGFRKALARAKGR
jgi:hypothetical protein